MKSRGLGGVMFWELDGDSISADLSLVHTARKTLASMLPLVNRRKYHKDSMNKIHADTKE